MSSAEKVLHQSPFIIVSIYNNYKVPYFIINYSYIIYMALFMQLKLFNFQVPRSCELESPVFCLSQLQDVVQSSSWTTNLGSLAVQWLTIAIYCHLLPSQKKKMHRRMRNQLSQWLEDEKLGEASPSLDTRGYFDDWPNKHR